MINYFPSQVKGFAILHICFSQRIRRELFLVDNSCCRRDVGIPPYRFVSNFQSCIVGRPDPRPPLVQTADLYCSKIQHSRLPNYLSLRRPLAACGNPFPRREQLRFKFVIGKHVRIRSLFFDIAIPTARSTGCHATQAHWLAMTALYYSPRFRQKLFDIATFYCRRAEVCPPYDGQYNLMTPQKQFNPSAEPTHFLFTFHSSLFSVKKEIFDFFFNNVYALFSLLLSTFYGTIKCKTFFRFFPLFIPKERRKIYGFCQLLLEKNTQLYRRNLL